MNLNKSLEELENRKWHEPPVGSAPEVLRLAGLRCRKLRDLSTEDIRFMIAHNIGLAFLVPLAIRKMSANILLMASLYNGDLLKSILSCDQDFWLQHERLLNRMQHLLNRKKSMLENSNEDDFNIKTNLLGLVYRFLALSPAYSY